MAFQWIFNNAESISADNRAVVGQTITRNQTVRSVSRGPGIWKFTVQLPDGMRWSEIADEIEQIMAADRYTVETVALMDLGYTQWITNGIFNVGQTWDVVCVEMPTWTIFARDQVSWSGPFVFYESQV